MKSILNKETHQTTITPSPIKVTIGDTDLELMKRFVDITDEMGLYKWGEGGYTEEQIILKKIRSLCFDVCWFNRDKNPYESEVK
jgi:hypothetical protein